MTGDCGYSGEQDYYLGAIGYLGDKNSQGSLTGINNAYCHSYLSPKLTKGIGGAHIGITHLPYVSAFEQMPGNIGSGD